MAQPPPDPVHILHNPYGSVTAMTVIKIQSVDEQRLVSGSENGNITFWNLKTYRPDRTWQGHNGSIIWLSTTENGFNLVSHCRRELMVIWSVDGEPLHSVPINHEGFCKCSLKTNLLAIPCGKNNIKVLDITQLASPIVVRSLSMKDDEGALMAIKFTPYDLLLAAYESGCICLWDQNVVRHQVRVDNCMPTCLSMNDSGKEILVGTSSETLYIFDDRLIKKEQVELTNPGLNAICYRRDARIFATAGWDKRLRIFSVRKHKKLCVLVLHDDALNDIVFVDHLLACGSSDAQISLWNLYNNP